MKILNAMSLMTLTLIFVSCGNPVKILKKEINKQGYILYQNPIEHAGSGTLVGGPPSHMMLVAHPQTCFPDTNEFEQGIRHNDPVVLPDIAKSITTSGNMNIELLDLLGTGSGVMEIGAGFDVVETIKLSFEDVSVEYLDSVMLKVYYDNMMDSVCKEFLDQVGFVVQALKVGKMKFEFTNNSGALIELTTPIIEDIVKLGFDVQWRIENKYSLVIETPKYLGYQLGQLRKKDNGFAFYRAATIKKNKYQFKSMNVFDDEPGAFVRMRMAMTSMRAQQEIEDWMKVEQYSEYSD